MAVKIRLKRFGAKNKPFWRIVVADGKSPRDGRFIEEVGTYDPKTEPMKLEFKETRIQHWLTKGAQPTEIVSSLLRRKGLKKPAKITAK